MKIQSSTTTHLLISSLDNDKSISYKNQEVRRKCVVCENLVDDSDIVHSAIGNFCTKCWNDYFGKKQVQK